MKNGGGDKARLCAQAQVVEGRIVDAEDLQALGEAVEVLEVAADPAAAVGDHARHLLGLRRHIAVGGAVDGEGEGFEVALRRLDGTRIAT